jgi:hypothetical protein
MTAYLLDAILLAVTDKAALFTDRFLRSGRIGRSRAAKIGEGREFWIADFRLRIWGKTLANLEFKGNGQYSIDNIQYSIVHCRLPIEYCPLHIVN